MDIVACLQCLQPTVPRTTLRQCRRIAMAMLVMTGRVTMLGLSRWAGPGGSYRTGSAPDGVFPICISSTNERARCSWRIKGDPCMSFPGSQFRLKLSGSCSTWEGSR